MEDIKVPHIQYWIENVSEVEEFIGDSIEVDEANGSFILFTGSIGCSVNRGDFIIKENNRLIVMPPSIFEKHYRPDLN